MRLLTSRDIENLTASGDIHIDGPEGGYTFLDDFRIGLSLRDQFDTPNPTPDIRDTPSLNTERLTDKVRKKGDWGLCYSNERIGLGARFLGLLQTRSKYARKGLELMGSSWIVAPGFGQSEPSSIVFEVSFNADVKFNSCREHYGYMALFDVGTETMISSDDYARRFPFFLHHGVSE